LPVVDEFLREMAPYEPPEQRGSIATSQSHRGQKFQQDVEKDEALNFLLRVSHLAHHVGGFGGRPT